MAKTQANYPTSLDVLNTDRISGQVVTSGSYDVIEDAITEIEAELRRVTTKTATGTLTASEGGLILVSAAGAYTLYLPTAVGNTGLEYTILKTDDNTNLVTIDADGTETINGALTFTGLNYQWACIGVKSNGANWVIKAKIFDPAKNKLSAFAATTSAELAGVISDETGSGALVFGTSPVITTPTGIVKADVGLGNVTDDAQITKALGTTAGDIIQFTASATPARIGIGTAGQVLTVNAGATAPVWAAAGGGSTYARVTGANATTTGQILVNIAGLSIALLANSVYEFEAVLTILSTVAAAGNKYGVNYSQAGASVEAGCVGTGTNENTTVNSRISALNTATTVAFLSQDALGVIFIKGILITGATAGNLTIQHLKVASGTATVYINSFLKVTKVA